MAYWVEFQVGSTARTREMPNVPRVGEIVDLTGDPEVDGSDRIVLKVKNVIHIEEGSSWQYYCHTTEMQDWLREA